MRYLTTDEWDKVRSIGNVKQGCECVELDVDFDGAYRLVHLSLKDAKLLAMELNFTVAQMEE